jgi:hypothetical protein
MQEAVVRRGKASTWVIGVIVTVLAAGAMPALAQESEEFPGPDAASPLAGYTRSDGTVVLTDDSFCRLLLGSLWGDERLTYADLIDKSKKQKKARKAAFAPAADEATVAGCVDVISAYRTTPPEEDTLVAWSRRSPIVPEALAGLLADDFEARPLAQPDEIGAAARTSGYGDQVSAPFEMLAETWLAEVDNVSCEAWTGTLRNAREAREAVELTDIREYLYDVEPGHYYWDVLASDCDWSVDLVPVELGPVPTPTPLPRAVVPQLFGPEWRRTVRAPNPDHFTAAQARQTILEAGLVTGVCNEDASGANAPDRVWRQEPVSGSRVEFGSAVDIWIGQDCDVFRGDRVVLE